MTTVQGTPFWENAPEAYGTLTLGRHTIRGITGVTVKRARKRDKKSAPGKNGVKLGNKGFEAASVKITWQVHREEGDAPSARWDETAAILADLEDAKVAEVALTIVHPFCGIRGVSAVVVDDIDGPNIEESSGLFTFSLDCTEYLSPAATKKGVGAGGGSGGGASKVAGETFQATYVFPGGDATKPLEGLLVEPQLGVYREASSGKKVTLLAISPTASNPEMLTPRERERQQARQAAEQATAATFANPDSKGAGFASAGDPDVATDIAFIEDDDGARRPKPTASEPKRAATALEDLLP